ncbi:MAG: hypothetical protein ACPG8W_20760 [Candidatus Promineifilaceae bacterium]
MIRVRHALFLLIFVFAFASCDAPPAAETPAPVVTSIPTEEVVTSAENSSPTPTTDSTAASESNDETAATTETVDTQIDEPDIVDESTATEETASTFLPAPIYFVGAANEQVMRLERDGATVTQITEYPQSVLAFDFSAETNTLVLVTNNQLIAWNAGVETVLFEGGQVNSAEPENFVAVLNPNISPDGTQVTFGYNGIFLMATDGNSQPTLLLENPELPDFSNPDVVIPEDPLYFFGGAEFSPNGQKLLINFGYFPEGGGLGIYDLASETFTDLSQGALEAGTITCCEFAWSADGSTGYIISDVMIYGSPGLAEVTLSDHSVRNIISSPFDGEEPLKLFRSGHVTEDGSLLTFIGSSLFPGDTNFYEPNRVTSTGEQSLLGERFFNLSYGDILWAEDGSGVVFNEKQYNTRTDSLGGARWVNIQDDSVLQLPISGRQYIWGAVPMSTDMISAESIAELKARASIDFVIPDEWTIDDISARPLLTPDDTLWLVYSTGGRFLEATFEEHRIGIYRYANKTWEPLYVGDLGPDALGTDEAHSPDYLGEGDIEQAFIEPNNLWLLVTGGVGAHSGVAQLLKFDGTTMSQAAFGFNSSPDAGYVEDLDGDGWQELILNHTDPYIFCYACGVRLANYAISRWNGTVLETVQLVKLEGDSAEIIANNNAIDLANANLWSDAELEIRPYETSDNPTIRWNAEHILLTGSGRSALAESPYPLFSRIFYGDYAGATFSIGNLAPEEIFDITGPLIVGTLAEDWSSSMLPQIIDFSSQAIVAQPNNAGAHFLRGWASYLIDPSDSNAVADVLRAAELEPDHYLYPSAAAYFENQ